jgi:hypothetical protein
MKNLKLATAGVFAFTALTTMLAPATANAAMVSGNAVITIDNSALAASSINVAGGYPNGWIVSKFWDASYNTVGIDGVAPGGLTLPTTGSTAMNFAVNTTLSTLSYPSAGTYGRTVQATTMELSDGIQASEQIGLSGGWLLSSAGGSGVLAPYDFNLKKTAGIWNVQTYDNGFSFQNFLKLTDVTENIVGGELYLSGNLKWTGLWASLVGANTNTVVGTFNLAPSAVPVPAAVWMFGSGLIGLIGFGRKRANLAA